MKLSKHGILLAGINEYKIYLCDGIYRLVRKSRHYDIPENKESIVASYVNLHYANVRDEQIIINNFLTYADELFKTTNNQRGK